MNVKPAPPQHPGSWDQIPAQVLTVCRGEQMKEKPPTHVKETWDPV